MANDRLGSLEDSLQTLRATVEARWEKRDGQVGDIATEIATLNASVIALEQRLAIAEAASKPATFISIWGPAAATFAIIGTLASGFVTMLQREQAAQDAITVERIAADRRDINYIDKSLIALGLELRQADKEIWIRADETRRAVAALEAHELDMFKQMEH